MRNQHSDYSQLVWQEPRQLPGAEGPSGPICSMIYGFCSLPHGPRWLSSLSKIPVNSQKPFNKSPFCLN